MARDAANINCGGLKKTPDPFASLACRLGLRLDLPQDGRDRVPTYENSFLHTMPSLSVARSGRPLCL